MRVFLLYRFPVRWICLTPWRLRNLSDASVSELSLRPWEVSYQFWHGTIIMCTVCHCLQCPCRVQSCFHFYHLGLWLASYSSPFFSHIPLDLSLLNSQEVKHWRFLSSRLIIIIFEDVTYHLNTCYQLCSNDANAYYYLHVSGRL